VDDGLHDLKVPLALRPRASEVIRATDRFCAEHLDAEYGQLCRRLVARLSRKRPSPLERGDPGIWAGAVLHAIGSINFLFDPSQRPHLPAARLCQLAGVSPATAGKKSRDIRTLLRLQPFDPEFSRRELAESSPWRDLAEIDGLIIPAHLLLTADDVGDGPQRPSQTES
jgi:Domain of unknown function (DUF6398)